MPKVTEAYIAGKKNLILECTEEILKEKPLYQMTMRDIIKKAGFSQGVIYRYYANLDEIFIDFINRHTTSYDLEQQIDTLLGSELPATTILTECLVAMGQYVAELLQSIVGKTFFELLVMYSSDPEKSSTILPELKFRQSLEYAQYKTVQFALASVEKGVFTPQIPVASIIQFVSVFIDGIAQHAVFSSASGNDQGSEPEMGIPELFQTLSRVVIDLMNVQ
jgi:AcrR family transcriptional regulator